MLVLMENNIKGRVWLHRWEAGEQVNLSHSKQAI